MQNILYTLIIYPLAQVIEVTFVFFYALFKSTGFAVIGVSIGVSVLCLPLYIVAEKWQETERKKVASMASGVARIKKAFRGDEGYMVLSTFYRQNNYSPIMALRSSFGLLIQIPFFIAAYSFLSNCQMLQNKGFLFIRNLGSPDALFSIGGFAINILPIAMTAINIIAGAIYSHGHPLREKVQIYVMALIFLVILYQSPAGLVLYWTMNNLFSLVKNIFYHIKKPLRILYILLDAVCLALIAYLVFIHPGNTKKRALMVAVASLFFFTPLIVKAVQASLKHFGKNIEKDGKALGATFFFSSLALGVLVALTIPAAVISSSTVEFVGIDGFAISHFFFTFALQAAGIFLFWTSCIYFLFGRRVKTFFALTMLGLLLVAVVNTFVFQGNYATLSRTLSFAAPVGQPPLTLSLINIAVILLLLVAPYLLAKLLGSSLWAIPLIALLALGTLGSLDCIKIAREEKIALAAKESLQDKINGKIKAGDTFESSEKAITGGNLPSLDSNTSTPLNSLSSKNNKSNGNNKSNENNFSTTESTTSIPHSAKPDKNNFNDSLSNNLATNTFNETSNIANSTNPTATTNSTNPTTPANSASPTVANGANSTADTNGANQNLQKPSPSKTQESIYTLSKSAPNVILLMLDRASSAYFPLIMDAYPEIKKAFSHFTYYPNTVSFNQGTLLAASALFGGWDYTPLAINARKAEKLVDKHNEALKVLPTIFEKAGFATTVCDLSWANYSWIPDLSIFNGTKTRTFNTQLMFRDDWIEQHPGFVEENITSKLLIRNMLFFSLFKISPMAARDALYNDGSWWSSKKSQSDIMEVLSAYSALCAMSSQTKATESPTPTFFSVVNDTTHSNSPLPLPEGSDAKKLAALKDCRATSVNIAALNEVALWLNTLRREGVYNNTRILISADHGLGDDKAEALRFKGERKLGYNGDHSNPLFLFKDFSSNDSNDSNEELVTDNTFMTNADAPYLLTKDLIPNATNPFTHNPLRHEERSAKGIVPQTNWRPGGNGLNTFKIDEKQLLEVSDNIFDYKNWKVMSGE